MCRKPIFLTWERDVCLGRKKEFLFTEKVPDDPPFPLPFQSVAGLGERQRKPESVQVAGNVCSTQDTPLSPKKSTSDTCCDGYKGTLSSSGHVTGGSEQGQNRRTPRTPRGGPGGTDTGVFVSSSPPEKTLRRLESGTTEV